jgi:hypothetical protein
MLPCPRSHYLIIQGYSHHITTPRGRVSSPQLPFVSRAPTLVKDDEVPYPCLRVPPVRTLTVYSNKFTLDRINKLLIAYYHLNVPIYQLNVTVCPAIFP